MKHPVYKVIASSIDARLNCRRAMERENPNAVTANTTMEQNEYHRLQEWVYKHEDTVRLLVSRFLPSGSGWDLGTKVDWGHSTGEKIVFYGGFHHTDDAGGYAGWTDHTVTVRPSLRFGIDISISGRNRNDIKEYLADSFHYGLTRVIEWDLAENDWKEVA